MPRYVAWLPVAATAKFVLETDEPITDAELKERFLQESEPEISLCYYCANGLDCDFQVIEAETDEDGLEVEIEKEK